jgi:hypothetical protein
MRKFCNDIIEFLNLTYEDGYDFNIEITHHMFGEPTAELYIKLDKNYTLKVPHNCIYYLYQLYLDGKLIDKNSTLAWQKELINIIEVR